MIAKESSHSLELPIIDWELCLKLASNKEAVAKEILLLVIQHLPGDLEAIKLADKAGDHAELLRCVHKLHGALCYSGMPRLKNAVFCLESLLKQKAFDLTKLKELSKNLEIQVQAVLSSPHPSK